ncbi:tryptophan synthase subunit alpha [Gracilimonas sediminicola]|uniref:Tryptophan synthase alpha chain n=1 Tax=Gracilimonas sediminicola TaxID=2952158 RepID=A0A9X2L5M9_9BACT|nr:tryptophan synthase subunit alpha [Gracilimonas sediminicola]MCP9292772.1 tryptophan synthase subunit alpha [Gracilimonas sediminicola]
MNRIQNTFTEKGNDSKLMSLFLTAGFPDLDATVDLILGFEKNGADIIELGMPFSDPLADGPTIQYSSDVAIQNGITMEKIFGMVKEVRKQSEIPIILMGYMNPVLRYGVEKFCARAEEAGVDGLIIPDIPIEEGGIIEQHAKNSKLSLIYLVAPNTSDERMKQADEKSQGFVYCVSVTGVTGAREGEEVSKSVNRFIERVKTNITHNPVMVGFGIKSHEDAVDIASNADGFIVGSALIDTIKKNYPNEGWQSALFSFVHSLKFGN